MARRGVGETKKHLARAERERRQRKWILGGTIVVAVLLVGILGYGIYDTAFVRPKKMVAEVNGNVITASSFEGRVRLAQRELLSQLTQYVQMESFFGADTEILEELRSMQVQLQTQLANPGLLGSEVLNSLITETILIAEAESQGVSVSEEELQAEVQRNFNFYPDGTPTSAPTLTPLPTLTLDPTSVAAATPTSSPTAGPTVTPRPTATPYTFEAYQQDYDEFIKSLADFRISEEDFLSYVEIGLLESKMRSNYVADIDPEEEQVFARLILTESEEVANEVLERLEAGETWEDLALEYSQDPSTAGLGGEIGWSTIDELIARYGELGIAAFTAPDGEVVGPFQAQGEAFFLFRVDAREERPMSESAYQLAVDQAFNEWLQGLRDEAEVTIAEEWQDYLPPAVPMNL
jgi:parvulin-like peptidyl-prolyl isomerase